MKEFDFEGFIPSGSAQIHYYERGEGEPLLLLHGNGEDASCFSSQVPVLSRRCRCIAVESRGHGKSTRGTGELTLSVMADDVLSVIDSLRLGKAHILGFSDGGNVAIHLALKAPEKIASLILCGANADPDGLEPKELSAIKSRRRRLKARSSEKAKRELEILELMLNEPHFTEAELKSIALPTLITAGENDMILGEHTDYLHKCIKHSKLCIFKDGSHFVHMEQPALFNETILNFLNNL